MKTKHIFTAMLLPALFAACTADEFTENNSSMNVADRALLAPFTITVGQDDADTRFAWSDEGVGNWKWENGDAFSAFLVDQNWTVSDNLYTNYIYKSNDGGATYETTSQMVEGIYWFYAPAAEDKNTRDLIPFELATSQDEEYYKSDAGKAFFTALYKLTKDDDPQNLPLSFVNYYSRAVFPLANNTDATLKIKQIVLQSTKPFVVKGNISTKKLGSYMYAFNEEGELVSALNLDDNKDNDETVSELKTRLYTADLVEDGDKSESNVIVLNLNDGVAIEKGATKSFTMLVPRTEPQTTCSMKIITDKGVVEVASTDKSNYAKNVQFKHNGVMPMFGLESNGSFKAYSIDEDKFTDLGDAYYIGTYDEMIALINTVNGKFSVYNLGDWAIDAAMAKALANSDSYVEFMQPMTIKDADAEVNLTKAIFSNSVTVAKGTSVVFAEGKSDETPNQVQGEMTIEEGASVTVKDGKFANNTDNWAAEITNNGSLTVIDGTFTESGKTAKIITSGELTLTDNDEMNVELEGGKLTYATAKTTGFTATTAKLTNSVSNTTAANAEIIVNAKVKLTLTNGLTAETGKVSNVTYKTTITNNGEIAIPSSQKLEINGALVNNGVISGVGDLEINGTATNAANAKISATTTTIGANATVANSGEMSAVTNNGKITTASGSRTNIASGTGTINNTALAYVAGTLTNQTVVYEITEAMNSTSLTDAKMTEWTGTYKINKLVFKNKLTVDGEITTNTAITAIDFESGSEIDVKAGKKLTLDKVAKVGINANVKFGGFDDTASPASEIAFNVASEITINKNCTLTINYCKVSGASSNLTFTSVPASGMDKAGQVVNNGTVTNTTASYTSEPWWTEL